MLRNVLGWSNAVNEHEIIYLRTGDLRVQVSTHLYFTLARVTLIEMVISGTTYLLAKENNVKICPVAGRPKPGKEKPMNHTTSSPGSDVASKNARTVGSCSS